jgi:hypothetical protein
MRCYAVVVAICRSVVPFLVRRPYIAIVAFLPAATLTYEPAQVLGVSVVSTPRTCAAVCTPTQADTALRRCNMPSWAHLQCFLPAMRRLLSFLQPFLHARGAPYMRPVSQIRLS